MEYASPSPAPNVSQRPVISRRALPAAYVSPRVTDLGTWHVVTLQASCPFLCPPIGPGGRAFAPTTGEGDTV